MTHMIEGGLAVDDRGTIRFVNDFDFKDVKRFYQVSNHQQGFVRAWHGHAREGKHVYVSQGAAIVATVPLYHLERVKEGQIPPDKECVKRVVLSASRPQILYVPPGHANGFKTLTKDTTVIFFSTATLEESQGDDFRYDANIIPDVWSVKER